MAKKYKAKYTGKVYDTKDEAIKDNTKYLNDADYRFAVKSSKLPKAEEYDIPFIESKRRTLTNAGLATGAVLSENMLDSIAKYANAADLPIKTALGLAVKESTLGNPTDDKSVYTILRPKYRKMFSDAGTGQHINPGQNWYSRALVNYHKDIDPYQEAIKYAENKVKVAGKRGSNGVKNFDTNYYMDLLVKGEKYADKKAIDYSKKVSGKNVLQLAFEDYKENPNAYNPGQHNYQQLVNKRANEVWASPEIQDWYKTYSKRSLEEGGKREQKANGGSMPINGGTLPEVIVDGYAPLRLTTYYPIVSKYPFTGHSKLDIPIHRNIWEDYTGENFYESLSPYITIDKQSSAKDYNLVTNNCADAVLNYLNKAFDTEESPALFTTPGDVQDYAVNKLNGKLIDNNDGTNTVLIPRNKNNAKRLSSKALDLLQGDKRGTLRISYKARFKQQKFRNGGSIHIAPSKRGTFTAAATKHGMGVQEFASRVLRNKDNYSPAMVKKANFARNASKWNH